MFRGLLSLEWGDLGVSGAPGCSVCWRWMNPCAPGFLKQSAPYQGEWGGLSWVSGIQETAGSPCRGLQLAGVAGSL